MKQKITIPIKSKIITIKDIQDIAEYLFSLKIDDRSYYNLHFYFKNGIEVSSDDLSCLKSRSIEEYEVKRIWISYRSSDYANEIQFYLINYDFSENSNIEISSNDEVYLGSVAHKLEELVGFMKSQSKINIIYKNSIVHSTIVTLFSSITTFLIVLFLKRFTLNAIYLFIPFFILLSLMNYAALEKLFYVFPNIEIDISDKTNKSKEKKKYISFFVFQILLPIIINIISSFIR